ncbi:hypothetical protein [Mycobacterium paraffinicum]|nr:hypothetical protein [Mycobacterium paraffinicum]
MSRLQAWVAVDATTESAPRRRAHTNPAPARIFSASGALAATQGGDR